MAGLLDTLSWTIGLAGQQPAYARGISVAIAIAAVAALAAIDVPDRRRALAWLLVSLGATVIGAVEARVNLLIFPISFYAMFLASVAVPFARRGPALRAAVALVLVTIAVLSVRASRLEQLSLHPMSTDQIYRDWSFVHGPRRAASIPAPRRERLEAKLERLGIADANFDFDTWEDEVRATGRRAPSPVGLFLPERRFLDP